MDDTEPEVSASSEPGNADSLLDASISNSVELIEEPELLLDVASSDSPDVVVVIESKGPSDVMSSSMVEDSMSSKEVVPMTASEDAGSVDTSVLVDSSSVMIETSSPEVWLAVSVSDSASIDVGSGLGSAEDESRLDES